MHAGVLPDCYQNTYQNTNINIQTLTPGAVSCFIRHPDGIATCPMDKLFFVHSEKNGTVYASHKACRSCTCHCTDGLKPKEVKFGPATVYVPMHMYGIPDRPLQQILSDAVQPDPYHAFDRASQKAAYILLTIRKDIEKQKKDAHP